MADREKVITGLECCSVKQSCSGCPWVGIDCNDRLHLAALELLKEQQETIVSLQGTINKLNAALAEQPEQKHGHWILWENQRREEVENGNFYYLCSQCNRGDVHAKTQDVPYCWWCGAKMDEEVNEQCK